MVTSIIKSKSFHGEWISCQFIKRSRKRMPRNENVDEVDATATATIFFVFKKKKNDEKNYSIPMLGVLFAPSATPNMELSR